MADKMRDTIAANIRRLRMALGLSQSALAERMGCTQARIAQLESGARSLPTDDLPGLAEALSTTPAALVTTSAKSEKKGRRALARS